MSKFVYNGNAIQKLRRQKMRKASAPRPQMCGAAKCRGDSLLWARDQNTLPPIARASLHLRRQRPRGNGLKTANSRQYIACGRGWQSMYHFLLFNLTFLDNLGLGGVKGVCVAFRWSFFHSILRNYLIFSIELVRISWYGSNVLATYLFTANSLHEFCVPFMFFNHRHAEENAN